MSLSGSGAPAAPSWTAIERALAIILVAFLGLRFVAITMDPPGGIVSFSGAMISDEGAYLKAARLHQTFGVWSNASDWSYYYVAPVFVGIIVLLGHLPGNLLVVARYASVVFSIAAIAAFYRICRYRRTRAESLACCLIVATSFDSFAFSRLAFAEPLGTLFGLLALLFWVGWRRRWLWAAASLLCALLAVGAKSNFAYTYGAVLLLWLSDAVRALRRGRWRLGWGMLGVVAAAVALFAVTRAVLTGEAPDDAERLRILMQSYFSTSSLKAALSNEWMLLLVHAQQPWRIVLVVATLLGCVLWLAGPRRRAPAATEALEVRVGEEAWRPLAALATWAVLGLLFFGYFEYRPPRWLYFTVFPAAYAAVSGLAAAGPWRRRSAILVVLVLVNFLTQVPSVGRYLARPDKWSVFRAAEDVARRVEGDGRDVPMLGCFAHMVAAFASNVRPLASSHDSEGELPQRVLHWRPPYLVGHSHEILRLRNSCPNIIRGVLPVSQYTIMGNYFDGHDLVLWRLLYADRTAGEP